MEDREGKHRYRLVCVLFAIYMILLIYFLFFAEITGRTYMERDYHYNLVPFKEIKRFIIYHKVLGWVAVTANLLGNVVAFIPFGGILPVILKKGRSFWNILLLSFEFSLFVETVQLISKVGSFDVDDMFLNTLGGAIGYFGYWLFLYIRRKRNDKAEKSL